MNKQEFIKKLEELEENAWRAIQEGVSEGFWRSKFESYNHALKLAKQLDEPQKPVVPKFVAEWFEDNKDDLEFSIWELCVDSFNSDEQGVFDWIQQSENKPIETLVRMKDGYEVEKKPRWVVKLPNDYYFSSWVSLYSLEADGAAYKFYDDVFVFDDRTKAEAVATLVDGSVEKV